MNERTRTIATVVVVLLAFVAGFVLRGGDDGSPTTDHTTPAAPEVWTCSMHPQIQLPDPGACPICGMDLIALEPTDGGDASPRSLTLSPSAQRLAEIRTAPAERREATVSIRMVGKLEPDETRVREISAWVAGRIDRLHIDYTGVPVDVDDPLFELYSPELYSAQEELLQALRATDELHRSELVSTRLSATRTVNATRERLRLWGLTDAQIAAIESRRAPSDHVTILAPTSGVVLHKAAVEGTYVATGTHIYSIADLSHLWLKLDVYEHDLAWVEEGQTVEFVTEAYPGETFTGTVAFIDPVLDDRSRSVKIRVDVDNPDGRLKPGMFARAVLRAHVNGDGDEAPLLIPASAPLITGTRAVVYVAAEPGRFEGREVVLGPRAGDAYVVRRGLRAGEEVVVNGAFKIDSALQIQARPSMMSPEEAAEEPQAITPLPDVPPVFRERLDDLLVAYLRVSEALSRDEVHAAMSAAETLPSLIASLPADDLGTEAAAHWEEAATTLTDAARTLGDAADLDAARSAFYPLSITLIAALERFGTSGERPVYVYHCPMARNDAGADWLQSTEGTENPYYGSQMFRCGAKRATLHPAADVDAPHAH